MTGMGHRSATDDVRGEGRRASFIGGAARGLQFAAAPTFAAMALLTAFAGNGAQDPLCATAQHGSPLTGMVSMYVLMSAFHAAPWLRLMKQA
jgi:hypothetical protein